MSHLKYSKRIWNHFVFQATATVTVVVADVNDNAPEFTQNSYFAAINMIYPVAAHVITVKATDKD